MVDIGEQVAVELGPRAPGWDGCLETPGPLLFSVDRRKMKVSRGWPGTEQGWGVHMSVKAQKHLLLL